jgi:Domain of unknown function (DUF4265)
MTEQTASATETESVEVWFKLIKSADGYPKSQDWEELWARPSGDTFVLESIPFFETRVSRGDVIRASPHEEGFLQFDSVVRRGGHSTFRVLINPERVNAKRLMTELKRFGADSELTLNELIAVDVPDGALQTIEDFLLRGKEAERWGLQDGFIFESPVGESVPGGEPQ